VAKRLKDPFNHIITRKICHGEGFCKPITKPEPALLQNISKYYSFQSDSKNTNEKRELHKK